MTIKIWRQILGNTSSFLESASSLVLSGDACFERYVTLAEGCHACGTTTSWRRNTFLLLQTQPPEKSDLDWARRGVCRRSPGKDPIGSPSLRSHTRLNPTWVNQYLNRGLTVPRTIPAASTVGLISARTSALYARTCVSIWCATSRPSKGLIIVRRATNTNRANGVGVYVATYKHTGVLLFDLTKKKEAAWAIGIRSDDNLPPSLRDPLLIGRGSPRNRYPSPE